MNIRRLRVKHAEFQVNRTQTTTRRQRHGDNQGQTHSKDLMWALPGSDEREVEKLIV